MPGARNMACPEADQDGAQGGEECKELPPTLKVLVVACGIGGLVAGIACKRGGHEVTMLEQASGFQEVRLASLKA